MLPGCLRCCQTVTRDLFASSSGPLCPSPVLLAPSLLPARFHNPPSPLLLLAPTSKHHWIIAHSPCSHVLLIFGNFLCLTYCSTVFQTPSYNHISEISLQPWALLEERGRQPRALQSLMTSALLESLAGRREKRTPSKGCDNAIGIVSENQAAFCRQRCPSRECCRGGAGDGLAGRAEAALAKVRGRFISC